jgi:uncharacterized protein (DUF983 family)
MENNPEDPSKETKLMLCLIGGALYLGAFIVLTVKYGLEIPTWVSLMIWANNLQRDNKY